MHGFFYWLCSKSPTDLELNTNIPWHLWRFFQIVEFLCQVTPCKIGKVTKKLVSKIFAEEILE